MLRILVDQPLTDWVNARFTQKTLGGIGELWGNANGRPNKIDPFPFLHSTFPTLSKLGRIEGLFSIEGYPEVTKAEYIRVLQYILKWGVPPSEVEGEILIQLACKDEE